MKALIASFLLLSSIPAFANNCEEAYGSHKIRIEGRNIHLDYFRTGTLALNDELGHEAYYLSTNNAGGVSDNTTIAPLIWKPLMVAKDGVDAAQDWFHGANDYRDIQLFRKDEHPRFYQSIAKKFLKKLATLEADDESSELILNCIEKRLNEILK